MKEQLIVQKFQTDDYLDGSSLMGTSAVEVKPFFVPFRETWIPPFKSLPRNCDGAESCLVNGWFYTVYKRCIASEKKRTASEKSLQEPYLQRLVLPGSSPKLRAECILVEYVLLC